MTELFPAATRAAALERLSGFIARAGRHYSAQRNYDRGPEDRANVSLLSPYVRCRLLSEQEIVEAVLSQHSYSAAEKYVQEVLWRTYWKGWLELRPAVWTRYRAELDALLKDGTDDGGVPAAAAKAERGETRIACFDAWADELRETGYLHNHARMWFASIWIFTLGLPWQLGADFFMRHLLDGDPASNTLSWRWVAGLQTKGKTYLARPDNITRYTEGRFTPDRSELSPVAVPLSEEPLPSPRLLAPLPASLAPGRTALLITDDDLCPEDLIGRQESIVSAAGLSTVAGRSPRAVAEPVGRFVDAGLSDALVRAEATWNCPSRLLDRSDPAASILAWAESLRPAQIALIRPTAGSGYDLVGPIVGQLGSAGHRVVELRRPWDAAFWPHATKGFFPFKEKIRKTLSGLGVGLAPAA